MPTRSTGGSASPYTRSALAMNGSKETRSSTTSDTLRPACADVAKLAGVGDVGADAPDPDVRTVELERDGYDVGLAVGVDRRQSRDWLRLQVGDLLVAERHRSAFVGRRPRGTRRRAAAMPAGRRRHRGRLLVGVESSSSIDVVLLVDVVLVGVLVVVVLVLVGVVFLVGVVVLVLV